MGFNRCNEGAHPWGADGISSVPVSPSSHPEERVGVGEQRRDGPVAVRGGEPAARCPYCDHPFHDERLETLHRGLEHPTRIADRERAAFERAYLEEEAAIRRFRLQALGAVLLCYFSVLFLYAVVT
ncbi:DUF7410 domain-containing protein [Natronorubrum halalkaliphilum]|uniref:DUF7410 domain-containing protein n=1 Tax=Natronorubrum halalkaliphilum TaxID=2691917 RepID=UPI001F3914EC|nr:hypothetical protein [Natronorubrum halalkaliphilum]